MSFVYLSTIRCYTFNQSQYISQTLDGFTMQQTSFPFVINLVDDASTDGEQNVIINYMETNFNIYDTKVFYKKDTDYATIIFAQHQSNKNCYLASILLRENHFRINKDKLGYLKEWRDNAKYEAFCEGDDYWTNPQKLQMQVDYLEAHPECGLCYTDCDIFYESEDRWEKSIFESGQQERFNNENPMKPRKGWYTSNVTWVWRLSDYNKIPQDHGYKDRPLYTLLSIGLSSKLGYIPCSTGVYRRYEGSVSYDTDARKKFAYYSNSFFLQDFFIQKYPESKEVRRQYYDNRLFSTYAQALEFNDKDIIRAYQSFYPWWFMVVAKKEVLKRRGRKDTQLSFAYRVAWKMLTTYRIMGNR